RIGVRSSRGNGTEHYGSERGASSRLQPWPAAWSVTHGKSLTWGFVAMRTLRRGPIETPPGGRCGVTHGGHVRVRSAGRPELSRRPHSRAFGNETTAGLPRRPRPATCGRGV